MTFHTYSSSINTMIDELVNQLVAEDGAHFAKVTTDVATKACVHYTGNGQDLYIQFKARKSTETYYYNGTNYTAYVIEVNIGSAYDSYEVTSPARFGTALYATSTTGLETNFFATRTMTHTLWIDGNGFYWSCDNPYSDYLPNSFLLMMSFIPTSAKEWDDSGSGVFIQFINGNPTTNANTDYEFGSGGGYFGGGTIYKCGYYGYSSGYPSTGALFYYTLSLKSFKHPTNDKIYIDFPKFTKVGSSSYDSWRSPIWLQKRFFIVTQFSGDNLTKNDIVSWDDGGVIRKYILVKPTTGNGGYTSDCFAIPYENAVTY